MHGLKIGDRDDVILMIKIIHLLGQKNLYWLRKYLEKTPLEESHDVVVGAFPSPKSKEPILVEVLNFALIPSPSLSTNPPHVHVLDTSLGNFRGYVPSIDPYCAYLEDMPRKIY